MNTMILPALLCTIIHFTDCHCNAFSLIDQINGCFYHNQHKIIMINLVVLTLVGMLNRWDDKCLFVVVVVAVFLLPLSFFYSYADTNWI